MATSGLMLRISHKGLFLAEPRSQSIGIAQVTATIAAYVDDESPAEQEVIEHLGQVAGTQTFRERVVAYVPDVIVENLIADA